MDQDFLPDKADPRRVRPPRRLRDLQPMGSGAGARLWRGTIHTNAWSRAKGTKIDDIFYVGRKGADKSMRVVLGAAAQ